MAEIEADFTLEETQDIQAEFSIEETKDIQSVFEINVLSNIHNHLEGRDAEDCHPISSITGLSGELSTLQQNINNEKTRAEGVESELRTAIGDEETRAKGVEEELNEAIQETAGSIKNGVLTIQKNGTTVQTFSANQESDATANLIIPTKTSDITNDSDFATNSGVSTAVSNHNTSESAHSYIQGLISDEVTRAEGVEGALSSLNTETKSNLVSAINEVNTGLGSEITRAEGVEGTLSNLTTDAKTNLVSAINEVDSHADTNTSDIGVLDNLNTSQKDNLVDAINEVNTRVADEESAREQAIGEVEQSISDEVTRAEGVEGDLDDLTTDSKSNLVAAINEVDSHSDTNASNIGTLSSLSTDTKTDLVSAINEVDSHTDTNTSNIGTLTSLTTDAKGNLVSAINEVDSHTDTNTSNIGTLSSLNTDAKTDLVSAINEVDSHSDTNASNIGTLSNLTTDAKNNLVAAINEVDSHADTNTSDITTINSKIPNDASSSNQLADKQFVNSSISTNTANFIGTFDNITELNNYSGTVTNNDYAFVVNGVVTDSGNDWATFSDLDDYDKSLLTNFDYAWVVHGSNFDLYRFDIVEQEWDLRAENITKDSVTLNTAYNRYKANVTTDTPPVITWLYEYTLNNSSFTATQWAAINSGATTGLINQITTNENAIGTLSSLNTSTKTDLVSAVNEVNTNKVDANTAITGATYTKITYDSKGLVTGGTTLSASDIPSLTLSKISDVTATASEINVLDGITASTTELNYVDGVTSSIQTQLDNKVTKNANITGATKCKITYDSKGLVTGGADLEASDIPSLTLSKISDVTASASEVNVLDGITATTTELNYVDGVTSAIQTQLNNKVPTTRTVNGKALSSNISLTHSDVGAVEANASITGATKCKITYDSKGLVTSGADLQASDIPSLTLSKISDVTASASELNILDGATLTTTELNYVDGVTSSIQTQLNGKQPTGNYVTTDTVQTINQAATKTFNGRVNFVGTGDANAIYLSTDTRIDVYGTSRTVLGFANGTFLINNDAYPLNLRGSGARPAWNSTSNLALTSDIGNATLTIQKNGTAVDTFTANATSDKTINITVPTKTSDLTNDDGFITGINSSDVTTALGYTPYDASNPNGYTSNTGTVTSVNNVSPVNGNVSLSIPTVNNPTITITQGGVTKGSFTLNQSTDETIALDAGALPSQAGNNGKFLTTDGTSASWDNALSYKNISNCITEIPQDINLTLSSGTLTLKAGSKVYVPNGAGVFDAVTTSSDKTVSVSGSSTFDCFIYYATHDNNLRYGTVGESVSGSSYSITGGYWYDTTNNIIKRIVRGAVSYSGLSFPIAVVSVVSGVITSINQIFNGFGYMGSVVFGLPNVECLAPNGRNADGTLKNTKFKISSVITSTLNSSYEDVYVRDISFGWSYEYDEYRNLVHLASDKNAIRYFAYLGKYKIKDGKILYFTPKTTFHALDWNDKGTIAGFGMPSSRYTDLTLGASGTTYTAPANGWFMFRKVTTAVGQWCRLTNNACNIIAEGIAPVSGNLVVCHCPVAKGQVVEAAYSAAGDTKIFRFIYAEGEV